MKILDDISESCIEHIDWAYRVGKYTHAKQYYSEILNVTGVNATDATRNDFQRFFKCKNAHVDACKGLLFPKSCSEPPCDQCSMGKIYI